MRVSAPRSEFLKLVGMLDKSARLCFVSAAEVPVSQRVGLHAVFKVAAKDRLIVDARSVNCQKQGLGEFTQLLGSAAFLRYNFVRL